MAIKPICRSIMLHTLKPGSHKLQKWAILAQDKAIMQKMIAQPQHCFVFHLQTAIFTTYGNQALMVKQESMARGPQVDFNCLTPQ